MTQLFDFFRPPNFDSGITRIQISSWMTVSV